MEYAKKLWNHLHPSKLKEKIKVERPVYKHQKLKKKKIYVVFPKNFFCSSSAQGCGVVLLLLLRLPFQFGDHCQHETKPTRGRRGNFRNVDTYGQIIKTNEDDGRGCATAKPVGDFSLDPTALCYPQHRPMLFGPAHPNRWFLLADWSAWSKSRPSVPATLKKEANSAEDDSVLFQSLHSAQCRVSAPIFNCALCFIQVDQLHY